MTITSNPNREILSARVLNCPVESVYKAFANPEHLKNWWGPAGFTNTIHEFDLRPGGKWALTMHGPEQGHYPNASVFHTVEPLRCIAWTRETQPFFEMEVTFDSLGENKAQITFRMIFASVAECEKIRKFAGPKNEENFDRLERELARMAEGARERL